jgi:hypothetical protein
MIYRQADPALVAERERAQALRAEEELRERAEDRRMVRAMKNPLLALKRELPTRATRMSLLLTFVGILTPLVIALCSSPFSDRTVTNALEWMTLLSGVVLGLAAIGFAVRALIGPTSGRFVAVVALFMGLLVPLWGLVCAAVLALSHWRY